MLLQRITLALRMLFNVKITTLMNYKIWQYLTRFKSLTLFHINACSLNKLFDNLQHLLSCTNKNFDVITITEIKITKSTSLTNNITMNNFFFWFFPYWILNSGTLLYIADHLLYKPGLDLNVCKSNKLEPTFIEALNPKK